MSDLKFKIIFHVIFYLDFQYINRVLKLIINLNKLIPIEKIYKLLIGKIVIE